MSAGAPGAALAPSAPDRVVRREPDRGDAAIAVEDVWKHYSRFSFRRRRKGPDVEPALRDISFRLEVGETLGLLGPNGAGKTTLLKILTTLIYPTRGRVRVFNRDVSEHPLWVRGQLGLVSCDERSFYWRLTGQQNLEFFGTLYGLPKDLMEERIGQLLETLGLTFAAHRPYQGYSSGMKQKLAIARGLLSDPRIVIYDEPTRSLDPVSVHSIRTWITEKKEKSPDQSQVIATNQLSEAEELCDRVLILNRGRIIAMGTPEEIRERFFSDDSEVHEIQVRMPTQEIPTEVGVNPEAGLMDSRSRFLGGGVWEHTVRTTRSGEGLNAVLQSIMEAGGSVLQCKLQEVSFDEVFRSLVLEENVKVREDER